MLTWSWIIQITLISLILIFLVHHLLIFFTSLLTIPKTKDLVNTSNQKYKDIYDVILANDNANTNSNVNNSSNHVNGNHMNMNNNDNNNNSTSIYNLEDILPPIDNNKKSIDLNMKNELKNFIKSQLDTNHLDSSDISTLENMQNQSNYSFIN
jgi:hypothetical protein